MPLILELFPPAFPALFLLLFARCAFPAAGSELPWGWDCLGGVAGAWKDLCCHHVPLCLVSPPCHLSAPWLGWEGLE